VTDAIAVPCDAGKMQLPWPLPERTDLRDRLLAAYSTGRGYHDLRHLAEVLVRLDELGVGNDVEVVLAAWFHDAVYDGEPGAEERSARLAETELHGAGVDVAEVARLVRLTARHDPRPGDTRGESLCDADLAILAAPPDRYADYAAGVREEYAAHTDADFRTGRLAVLRELAARESLFRSAYAREHWEPRARENLRAEIQALGG
jgi:predicted metal-dependent HD superfamily phosphohydrolase